MGNKVLLVLSVLCCTWCVGVQGHGRATELTFELTERDDLCFFEDFEEGSDWVFAYHVIKGGKGDIDVVVESPGSQAPLYRAQRKQKDAIEFEAARGRYAFCFSNKFSTVSHKVVSFELHPEDEQPLAVEAGIDELHANTQLEQSMDMIHVASSRVLGLQREFRMREARGRYLAEVLNSRVLWWAAGQSAVLILMGIGQVCVLRCFFTEKRKPSRSNPLHPEVTHSIPSNQSTKI